MKPTQDFTAANLFKMKGRRLSEAIKKRSPKDKSAWLSLASRLEDEIADGSFRFRGLFPSYASGKAALSTSSAADALVLRKINDNIRRAYGIRQAQRSQAVRIAKMALSEWTPKGIVSTDLKSCFESITPRHVTDKLRRDGRVSTQTIQLLETFFSQAKRFGQRKYTSGLPRGILISSSLAELFLSELDSTIKHIPGVYIYVRYVDDILVLASRPADDVGAEVTNAISQLGLTVNLAKSCYKDAGCRCAFECKHSMGQCPCNPKCVCKISPDNLDYIDYLGYRLIFLTGMALKANSECYAMLARSKAMRIKMRVSRAITAYKRDKDFLLLEDRIRYLTTNVTVDRSLKRSVLRSGIAFTYDQYSEPPSITRFRDCSLDSLDQFLRTKVRILGKVLGLSYMQKRQLKRHSFVYGHERKHRSSFKSARIREIRECWIGHGR